MTGAVPPAADVVVLVGNPRPGARTRRLAEAVAEALLQRRGEPATRHRVLELAELVGVSFGPEPAYGVKNGLDPFAAVRSARLLIVATPAYKGSYTGLLKVFLDQFGHRELSGATAVPVAVAASRAHAQATASALRDVLTELGAAVPAPPLAALESELTDGQTPGSAVGHAVATRWADQYAAAVWAFKTEGARQ